MTWALCLNCGEIKFGAICPCPKCQVASTGDMQLDIAFSDHNLSRKSLEELGKVVELIHGESNDPELCFWTFIQYVSKNHSSILGVKLEPGLARRCEELLNGVSIPLVVLETHEKEKARRRKRRWWEFWKRTEDLNEDEMEVESDADED